MLISRDELQKDEFKETVENILQKVVNTYCEFSSNEAKLKCVKTSPQKEDRPTHSLKIPENLLGKEANRQDRMKLGLLLCYIGLPGISVSQLLNVEQSTVTRWRTGKDQEGRKKSKMIAAAILYANGYTLTAIREALDISKSELKEYRASTTEWRTVGQLWGMNKEMPHDIISRDRRL